MKLFLSQSCSEHSPSPASPPWKRETMASRFCQEALPFTPSLALASHRRWMGLPDTCSWMVWGWGQGSPVDLFSAALPRVWDAGCMTLNSLHPFGDKSFMRKEAFSAEIWTYFATSWWLSLPWRPGYYCWACRTLFLSYTSEYLSGCIRQCYCTLHCYIFKDSY